MDQSDGLQECSDVEVDVISDDDDDDEVDSRVSPRSDSPRGQYVQELQNPSISRAIVFFD